MHIIRTYQLSLEAEQDISDIFDFTEREFGFNQVVEYLSNLERLFENLIVNPMLGRERKEIRADLFSLIYISHIIFYRLVNDQIRVVRVLHVSRDLPRHLGPS